MGAGRKVKSSGLTSWITSRHIGATHRSFGIWKICNPCARRTIRKPSRVVNRGYDTRVGVDGWPTDQSHPSHKT